MCRPWILCTCRLKRTCCHTFPATKVLRPENTVLAGVLRQQCARNFNTQQTQFFAIFPFSVAVLVSLFSALCGAVCFQVLYCSRFAVYVTCARLWYSTDSHEKCKIFPNNSTTEPEVPLEVQIHWISKTRFSYFRHAVADAVPLAMLLAYCWPLNI